MEERRGGGRGEKGTPRIRRSQFFFHQRFFFSNSMRWLYCCRYIMSSSTRLSVSDARKVLFCIRKSEPRICSKTDIARASKSDSGAAGVSLVFYFVVFIFLITHSLLTDWQERKKCKNVSRALSLSFPRHIFHIPLNFELQTTHTHTHQRALSFFFTHPQHKAERVLSPRCLYSCALATTQFSGPVISRVIL